MAVNRYSPPTTDHPRELLVWRKNIARFMNNPGLTVPASAFTAGSLAVGNNDSLVIMQSLSITVHGDPVFLMASMTQGPIPAGTHLHVYLYRDSTQLMATYYDGIYTIPIPMVFVDTPPAGTYTYSIKAAISSSDTPPNADNRSLCALEVRN